VRVDGKKDDSCETVGIEEIDGVIDGSLVSDGIVDFSANVGLELTIGENVGLLVKNI